MFKALPEGAKFVTDTGYYLDDGFFIDDPKPNGKPWRWKDYPQDLTPASEKKPNIQLFRQHNELSTRMFDAMAPVNERQQIELWRLKDTFATSKHFGAFLWDSGLFDLAKFFSRRYWVINFEAIIKAMAIAGTHEAYIIVVNSAMGDGKITFENPNPGHLIINVIAGDVSHNWGVAMAGGEVEEIVAGGSDYDGENITFTDSTANITFQETVKLIELLNVNGMFVEVKPA